MCAQRADEIREARRQYMIAQEAGDVERCLSFWSDDGALMPPHKPIVAGMEALRPWYRDHFNRFDQQTTVTYEQIEVAGDWAFARGVYAGSLIPKAGGDPIPDRGKLLDVLRRQADGSWKWAACCWNSDDPG